MLTTDFSVESVGQACILGCREGQRKGKFTLGCDGIGREI